MSKEPVLFVYRINYALKKLKTIDLAQIDTMPLIDDRYCTLPEPNMNIKDIVITPSSFNRDDLKPSWEEFK